MTFPKELYEAEHQETIFGALFGTHSTYRVDMHLKPKVVYRSDTSRKVFLLYTYAPKTTWCVVVDPSKDGPVNATEAWVVDEKESWKATVVGFFDDIEHYLNKGTVPDGRKVW